MEVESSWFFCPYCGTDNRPKTFRPIIIACPHKFVEQEGFCVRCGACRDGRPSAAQRETQARIGKNFILFGLLIVALAFGVLQMHINRYPGYEYIAPYYEETYETDGGKAMRGDDYVSWAEMGGAALFGIGMLASVVSRLNAGRPRKGPSTR